MILYRLKFANGKSYIGITSTSLQRRLALHRSHAKREKRGALQRAIRKYGSDSFTVDILATSDNWNELCELEKAAIVQFNTFGPNGYNLTAGGEGALGIKMNDAQKLKISLAKKGCRSGIAPRPAGWRHSDEARKKIADGARGRVFSDERKARIGASKIGNIYGLGKLCSSEKKEKIAASQRGRVFSEETRAKMRKAKIGKKLGPQSPDHIAKRLASRWVK